MFFVSNTTLLEPSSLPFRFIVAATDVPLGRGEQSPNHCFQDATVYARTLDQTFNLLLEWGLVAVSASQS